MAIIKAGFEGVGTSSGAAWPLFGILAPILYLSAGSLGAMILSAVCTGVFLFFCLPIIFLSYKKLKQTEEAHTLSYMHKKRKLEILAEQFLNEISQLEKINSSENYLLLATETEQNSLLKDLMLRLAQRDTQPLAARIENYIETTLKSDLKPVPWYFILKSAFLTFPAVFGTIMGGAAGIMGILVGAGLLAGFTAVPMLGWGIFAFALTSGLILSVNASYSAYKTHNKEALTSTIKSLNKLIHNKTRAIQIACVKQEEPNAEENNASMSKKIAEIHQFLVSKIPAPEPSTAVAPQNIGPR